MERFHGALSNSLKATVTNERDWVAIIPYIEYAFRCSPIRGIGLSPYKICNSGYSMAMPIDMMMLKKFYKEHYSLPEFIVEMRNNMDRLNYIVRKNRLENRAVMKKTYYSKVTPFKILRRSTMLLT